jgi:hypothetical protein
MKLNDPGVASEEYAGERGLEARRSIYDNAEGTDPKAMLWGEIATPAPRHVLESTILLTHVARRLPDAAGPIRAGARTTVFVATKAG